MVPSDTMRASSQGGSFQVRLKLGPLDPVSEVHGSFSNRDLHFAFERQLRETRITDMFW